MTKVTEITRLTSTPTSMAISRSWAVARIALPIRVKLISRASSAMTVAVTAIITISEEPTMCATGSRRANSGMRAGKGTKSEVWARRT